MGTILSLSIMIFLMSLSVVVLLHGRNLISNIGFLAASGLFLLWTSLQIFIGYDIAGLENLSHDEFSSIYTDPNLSTCLWVAEKNKEDSAPPFAFIIGLFVEDKKQKSYSPETYNYMNEICQNSVELLVSGNDDTKELSWFERNALGKYVWTDEWERRYKKVNSNWQAQIDKQLENSKNKW